MIPKVKQSRPLEEASSLTLLAKTPRKPYEMKVPSRESVGKHDPLYLDRIIGDGQRQHQQDTGLLGGQIIGDYVSLLLETPRAHHPSAANLGSQYHFDKSATSLLKWLHHDRVYWLTKSGLVRSL